MQKISRRTALQGSTAALAALTLPAASAAGKTPSTAPETSLAADPAVLAYQDFERARLAYCAAVERTYAAEREVTAAMPPEPHPRESILDLTKGQEREQRRWLKERNRRTEAILGMGEDDYLDLYFDKVWDAYRPLVDAVPTTWAGLLCQIRAWHMQCSDMANDDVPDLRDPEDPYDLSNEVWSGRVYHEIRRLAGESRP